MTEDELIFRFEELEAGRILGDLDVEESKELQELSEKLIKKPDFSMELAAAAIEAEFLKDADEELPDHVLQGLHRDMAKFVTSSLEDKVIRPSSWKGFVSSDWLAWAAAAVFAALFVASPILWNEDSESGPSVDRKPAPEEARDNLLKEAGDLVRSEFSGTETYPEMSGRVVWSDSLQEGYMTLTDLPANDPTSKQYQLWIVDPSRDEKPVDGGVFDIPAGKKTAVIPIRNPLVVKNPQAFVITLEQPGGVVVSKQEVVVALAKAT